MIFKISLIAVAVLLLATVPGYIMMKRKMLDEACISGFSKILLFVCQPCLAVYTFTSATLSAEKLIEVGIFALLTVAIFLIVLGGAYLFLHKKYSEPIYRIVTIATVFANCAFFAIPIIEAILPEISEEVIVFTTAFAVVMNVIGWTLGAAIISGDSRYVSMKKIFLNPAMLGTVVALLIFVLKIPIEGDLRNMIVTTARMSTPLSMIIMGMRLATMELRTLFSDLRVYLTIAVKQIIMPLVGFGLVYFLPISPEVKQTFFIICACPVASVVLNFAEIVGAGQREAAKMLLLGTILSIVTLPPMMLLLPLLG
jgi:predicted permease